MSDFKELNPILHSQLRLAIMSLLVKENKNDFTSIRKATGSTSGNLSIQIKKLEEAGYVSVEKSFNNNYPLTMISITTLGLDSFSQYISDLKSYFPL